MEDNPSIFRVYVHWLMQLILFAICLPSIFVIIDLAKKVFLSPSTSSFIGIILCLIEAWFFASLALSTVEVSDEKIRVKVPYGNFSMKWDEVENIVTDGSLFAFQGGGKQLSAAMVMAGKGKKEFYEFLNKQIEARKITVEQSAQVPSLHRKTRE